MLSLIQIDKLDRLLGDELLLKTIEQVFNETLDKNMPQVNLLDDNAKIGEKYRAYEEAKGLIRAAFLDLLSYKKESEMTEKSFNKER